MFRTFFIHTFGCRLNQSESAVISKKLLDLGLKVRDWKTADLVIINSCTITHKADGEVRNMIRKVKRENKKCFLVVCGCWVDNTANTHCDIDLLVKNKDKKRLIELIKIKGENKQIKVNISQIDKYHKKKKSLIKIQDGCNNFCSYCIVPYVRGRAVSIDADTIIKQIRTEVKNGVKEIILTGAALGSYKFKTKINNNKANIKNQLVLLLDLILTKTAVEKISFGSMSLSLFDKYFFDLYKTKDGEKRLARHFHIPLQSGSDSVLQRMKRPYDSADFLTVCKNISRKIKDSSIATDIIAGFPGETEKEFEQTLKTLKKLKEIFGRKFTKIHCFRYSMRRRTLAEKMISQKKWREIENDIKKQRAKKMLEIVNTLEL